MALLARARSWPLIVMLVVCVPAIAAGQNRAGPAGEDSLKAVFLFNFAKYVTWPAQEIGERSPSDIRICVTANDAFFGLLKAAVQGEHIDGKPLIAVALAGLDEAKACQILYVGDVRSADGKAWLAAVRGQQVLTVGDGPMNDETVISFVRDDNRIRFDINRDAAARHGLNVSSKLLRLARQVRDR